MSLSYLETLDILRGIESRHDVGSIRVDGVGVWQFLRLYLFEAIQKGDGEKSHDVSGGKIKTVLGTLFSYNPLQLLRHRRVWVFNGAERRKEIAGKHIHRVSGFAASALPDALTIEKPSLAWGHRKRSQIEERHIVSESWILLAVHAEERLLRRKRIEIENEKILEEIVSGLGVSFDWRYFVRFLLAQRNVIRRLMRLSGKPDSVLIECPYSVPGYTWALREKGVKVVELQHGVAGASHNAYVYPHESILYPDAFCVFGDREYDYFKNGNPAYAREVEKTGLYILERADRAFADDIFAEQRKKYRRIVVFAGQPFLEEITARFMAEVAGMAPDILFVYIPRDDVEDFPAGIPNLEKRTGVNIYEYLKWADIHSTVSSTTCLEATYFDTPTIFYDHDGMARKYYGDLLLPGKGVEYASDAAGFIKGIRRIDACGGNYSFPDVFSPFDEEKIIKTLRLAPKR